MAIVYVSIAVVIANIPVAFLCFEGGCADNDVLLIETFLFSVFSSRLNIKEISWNVWIAKSQIKGNQVDCLILFFLLLASFISHLALISLYSALTNFRLRACNKCFKCRVISQNKRKHFSNLQMGFVGEIKIEQERKRERERSWKH